MKQQAIDSMLKAGPKAAKTSQKRGRPKGASKGKENQEQISDSDEDGQVLARQLHQEQAEAALKNREQIKTQMYALLEDEDVSSIIIKDQQGIHQEQEKQWNREKYNKKRPERPVDGSSGSGIQCTPFDMNANDFMKAQSSGPKRFKIDRAPPSARASGSSSGPKGSNNISRQEDRPGNDLLLLNDSYDDSGPAETATYNPHLGKPEDSNYLGGTGSHLHNQDIGTRPSQRQIPQFSFPQKKKAPKRSTSKSKSPAGYRKKK